MLKPSIIVDIAHLQHMNFLREALFRLRDENYHIEIICLNRAKTFEVVKKELPGFDCKRIGHHRGTLFSVYWEANVLRFFKMLRYLLFRRYDIGISAGSFILGALLKMKGIPNLQFYDDPENKKNMIMQKLTSTELYYPPIVHGDSKIKVFNGLMEWAYLSPTYFKPDKSVLTPYNLKARQYVFVRDINPATTNYHEQPHDAIASIASQFPSGYPVILSLENKKNRNLYPQDWVVLEEPVEDIHSLIYYSRALISSGDSMAREGAMLGVPSIYCGIRSMKANQMLIEEGMLFKVDCQHLIDFLKKLLGAEIQCEMQLEFRQKLLDEWDDITEFTIRQIKKYEA